MGADGFEPPKLKSSRFTVCPIWPLWNTPKFSIFQCSQFTERESLLSDSNQRPLDYKSSALPTELKRRLFQQPFSFGAKSDAKVQQIFHSRKLFSQKPTRNPVFRKICQLMLTFQPYQLPIIHLQRIHARTLTSCASSPAHYIYGTNLSALS